MRCMKWPKNKLLMNLALFHLILSIFSIIGLILDSRLVDGFNPWWKVLRFDLSISIYLITMIWILQFYKDKFRLTASYLISVSMIIETILITMQAMRGIKSHFNVSTALDSIIFSTMGIAILLNTVILIWAYMKSLKKNFIKDSLTATTVRLGLLSLILGSAVGGYMSKILSHTVGGVDEGPGMNFLNWSITGGDLRIAHFCGLHGIQILIICFLILRFFKIKEKASIILVRGVFIIWAVFFSLLFGIAIQGKSLLVFGV